MIKLTTVQGIKAFLLSDRITLKGNEFPAFNTMITELAMEEQHLIAQARVHPAPVVAPVPAPPPTE